MARIDYDPATAASLQEVREIPRDGLNAWKDASPTCTPHSWFPEVTRLLDTCPAVEQACQTFAAAGFTPTFLEPVPQTDITSLTELLDRLGTLRSADTLTRSLTDAEYQRGRHRFREAAASEKPGDADLASALDLLVVR